MFKLPDQIPTRRDTAQEWADYAEFKSLQNSQVSLLQISRSSKLIGDEISVVGIEDESDQYISKVDEIATEVKSRTLYTNNRYPFALIRNDYVLQYQPRGDVYDLVYRFLLLTTRVNMSSDKKQGGIDGALLFEHLSAAVAKNYFGANAEVEIIGTSKEERTGFRKKLKQIVEKMGEGGSIHEHKGYKPQDDSVDIIVWKGFSDNKPSKVIALGQCKTGTSWQNETSQLNPQTFCKTWFTSQPIITPLNMFFTAQYFPDEKWRPLAYRGGLVFDRHRIMDYLPNEIEKALIKKIKTWCSAVEQTYNLNSLLTSESSTAQPTIVSKT
jgi:hypothetical protein